MAKMIGLARPLKLEWLNKTVDLILEGKLEGEIVAELNDYLSFEITSATSLRKTRESLINLWCHSKDSRVIDIREAALEAYKNNKAPKMLLHWCLLTVTYPVFSDICASIGKISSIQDTFTTAWLKEKLYETWGERTSLDVPVKNILRTLVQMGALEKVKIGVYTVKQMPILDNESIKLIIMSIMALKIRAYYGLSDLRTVPQFFPFVFDVTHEWIYNTGYFKLTNFAGNAILMDE